MRYTIPCYFQEEEVTKCLKAVNKENLLKTKALKLSNVPFMSYTWKAGHTGTHEPYTPVLKRQKQADH